MYVMYISETNCHIGTVLVDDFKSDFSKMTNSTETFYEIILILNYLELLQ